MNSQAARLVTRLVLLQLAVHAVTFVLIALFAPRVLLLEDQASSAALLVVAVIGFMTMVFTTGATLVVTRKQKAALKALAVGSVAVQPEDVLALYSLPSRLSVAGAVFA